jgi:hypothetical protein
LNSRPSACKADVITTRLPEPVIHNCGVVAQMVERTLSMREAQGSIPCYSTFLLIKKKQPMGGFEPPTFRLLSECSTPKLHWLALCSMVSPCGAMDSASDFGSGGWGFESPQGLFFCFTHEDNMAEWLRRQPAKLMGSARVGSNPTVVESFFLSPAQTMTKTKGGDGFRR